MTSEAGPCPSNSNSSYSYAHPLHSNSSQSPNALTPSLLAHTLVSIYYIRLNSIPESDVAFKNDILLWLAREIYHIDPPSPSYSHFRSSLKASLSPPNSPPPTSLNTLLNYLDLNFQELDKPGFLSNIFTGAKLCLSDPTHLMQFADSNMSKSLDKRSFLGIQLRRSCLKFGRMEIEDQDSFRERCKSWRDREIDELDDKGKGKGRGKGKGKEGPEETSQSQDLLNFALQKAISSQDQEGPSEDPRLKAFDEYQLALRKGDYYSSKIHLHHFFDYSPKGAERDLHQHFLLNLSYFHYSFGSLKTSHETLLEAIRLSRRNDDEECLIVCGDLLRRLRREEGRNLNPSGLNGIDIDEQVGGDEEDSLDNWNRIRKQRNHKVKVKNKEKEKGADGNHHGIGIDDLFDQEQNDGIIGTEEKVWNAVIELETGKSIPSILVSLLQTLNPQPLPPGSEKPLGPDSPAIPVNVPMTSISSSFTHPSEVLARLWSSLGEREISLNQMRISLEATTNGNEGRWDEIIRVKGECLKAWDLAESGRYDLSLSRLLTHSTINNLSFEAYKFWYSEIWKILWLKFRRKGETSAYRWVQSKKPDVGKEVDGAVQAEGELNTDLDDTDRDFGLEEMIEDRKGEKENQFGRKHWSDYEGKLKGLIFKARKLKEANQPSSSLSPLLKCISLSTSQGFMKIRREAIVLLADLMLDLGMGVEGKELLEREMEMLLEDHNLERRGHAKWVYAKCILASGKHSVEDRQHSIAWLEGSDLDFQATLNFPARLPVLYYLARLHHTMGDFDSRDSVAEEHEKVENAVKQLRGSRVPEDWDRLNEIEEIVAMVGGMVGNGWE